jgi:outer membrane protein TolC
LTSLTIARRRLELGDTTYIFVLTAELAYQQAALLRVQAQAARFTDTAALFQALGGGWWNRDGAEDRAARLRCRPPGPPKAAAVSQR